MFPFIERIFADGGYAGQKMALVAWRTGTWRLLTVKRSDAAGFEVLPKLIFNSCGVGMGCKSLIFQDSRVGFRKNVVPRHGAY